MFWREHSYVAFSTTYIGYLTLRRKSAYLRMQKISCFVRKLEVINFNLSLLLCSVNTESVI